MANFSFLNPDASLAKEPFVWKLFTLSFLEDFSFGYLFKALLIPAIILIGLYLLRRLGRYYISKKRSLVFLELIVPTSTNMSAYATEQLLTLFHSLAKQQPLYCRLFGYKKLYSLEIAASKEKGIRYILALPEADAPTIKRALLSYLPGIKINKAEDYLSAISKTKENASKERSLGIVDFKLSSDYIFPLEERKTLAEHDPISFITGNMTKLKPEEMIALQIVVTPIGTKTHRKVAKHIACIKQQICDNLPLINDMKGSNREKGQAVPWSIIKAILKSVEFLLKTFMHAFIMIFDTREDSHRNLFKKPFNDPVQENQSRYEQVLREQVKEKIGRPLFETSLRILIQTNDYIDYKGRVSGFLASFGPLASPHQSLTRKTKIPVIGTHLGLFKITSRKLSALSNPILSSPELADIYHFPYTKTTKTEDLVKTRSQDLPAPLSLKNIGSLDVTFGKNNYGGTIADIGLTDDDRSRHMYLIGQTGSGKSTIIHHMASDDIGKGRGLAVIDPHGDLAEGLLDTIPLERKDDLIYLNPFDIKHPIGINIMELTPDLEEDEAELERELVCESVVSILRRVFRKDENVDAHRIEYILRNTIYTAFTLPDPTIFTVYDLLMDTTFRKSAIKGLTDDNLINFWKNEFGKAGDYQVVKMVSGVTAKIGRFLFSPIAKRILEQPKSTIDFKDIVDNEKILIANLAEGKLGEDTAQLLGTTIIAKIHLAMTRRAQMESKDRKPFYLFVDEFQNFATSSFTKLLSGGRKYGLHITIAEQSTAQQDDRNIVNVILANVGTVVCFRTASPVDEDLMLAQFAPAILQGDIANLPRHHFYIKLAAIEPQDTFSGKTIPIVIHNDQVKRDMLIEASRKNYAIVYTKPTEKAKPVVPEKKTKQVKRNAKSLT